MINYTITRDKNGNKCLRVTPPSIRAFSIQTLGNLPETHRKGICADTADEVADYVARCGTLAQRRAIFAVPTTSPVFGACGYVPGNGVWLAFVGELTQAQVDTIFAQSPDVFRVECGGGWFWERTANTPERMAQFQHI